MIACFALSALAQPPHKGEKPTAEQLDKMKAHKVAFLTEKLSLSSEEAQNFWPIYNEKEEKLTALRKEMRAVKKDLKMDQMKDSEVESLINKHLEYRQQELDLEKEYIEKFKTALPIKKVAQIGRAHV